MTGVVDVLRWVSLVIVAAVGCLTAAVFVVYFAFFVFDRVVSLLRVTGVVVGYYRHRAEFREWLAARKPDPGDDE